MASSTNRTWSADQQLIEEITILKRLFIDSGAQENPYTMTKSLKYLLIICEPKLSKHKPEEIKARITWAEDNLHQVQHFVNGISIETDSTRYNKKQIMMYLEDTFSGLLKKLQHAGVYTRANMDQKEAMGDMSGS